MFIIRCSSPRCRGIASLPSRPRLNAAFSHTFDRAVKLCADAQRTLRARSTLVAGEGAPSVRRPEDSPRRAPAGEGRATLEAVSVHFASLRQEVEDTSDAMRQEGATEDESATRIKARVRFVLYDAAFAEHDAEPVVEHVAIWVRERYAVA